MPAPWSRARVLVALLTVPVLLLGPIVAAGQVLLPFLPITDEPLASENPAAAALALAEANGTVGDRIYPILTDQIAARAELGDGEFPGWEPLQTLGMPLWAGGVTGLGYPPNALALVLPPEHAAAPLAILTLFLAGLGTWLLLRRIELDPRAALVGALGVQLGGWAIANVHYHQKVDAALMLPWALWAIEGLARGRRWSATALVASIALSLVAGMIGVSVFVVCASGLYALWRLGWVERRHGLPSAAKRVALGIVLLVLGIVASLYWTLPLAETAGRSLRREASIEMGVDMSLPPAAALGAVVPDLAGPAWERDPPADLPIVWWLTPASMSARAEHGSVLEWNAYALVVVVLLALTGVVADPRRAAFPAALLVATFAFAQAWPLVRLFYAVPGLSLGAPQRVLGIAWILWPWLAALGVQALLARAPRALPALLATSLVAALALLLAWQRIEPAEWAADLQRTILERYAGLTTPEEVRARLPLERGMPAARHLAESLLRAGSAALATFAAAVAALLLDRRAPRFEAELRGGALAGGLLAPLVAGVLPFALVDASALLERGPLALLGVSAALVLAALAASHARRELPLWLPFAALLVIEGFLGTHLHVQGRAVTTEALFPPSPAIEAVREAAGDGRVTRIDPTPDLADARRLARPNMLVAYGIAELTPYPTFTPGTAAEIAARVDPRMVQRNHVAPLPSPELVAHPLLDLLRVTCVLAREPQRHARLVPVVELPGFCVYRRLGALPPARIVPAALAMESDAATLDALAAGADLDAVTHVAPEHAVAVAGQPPPSGPVGTVARVERPARNRLEVAVSGSTGGWLVVHEQWAPGWQATVDGEPVEVVRAEHAYRALPLPPSAVPRDLAVELVYAPRSIRWGAALSLVALLGVLAWDRMRA